jgi:hypothetical protein
MNTDNQTNEKRLAQICAASMAIIAGLIRLIPHPWNFTPIAGIGLFGGARLRSWWAYVLPLAIMAVSDLLLWGIKGHADLTLLTYAFNPWVYGSFLFAVLCGRLLLRNGSAARIAAVSLLVSVQFFLATNFSAWLTLSAPLARADGTVMAPFYTRDLSGLVTCYVAALPFFGSDAPPLGFFGNQLVGDLFYTGILFGAYALLRRGVLVPRRLRAPTVARTS